MRWLMCSSTSPFCWMIEPKYLNVFTLDIAILSMVTSLPISSLPLKQQCKCWVFDLLTLKLLESSVCLRCSNLSLTPFLVSSIRTISSANNINYGNLSWILLVSSSITRVKRKWLKAKHWCRLIPTWKSLVTPPSIITLILPPSYISLITRIYIEDTPFFSKQLHNTSR